MSQTTFEKVIALLDSGSKVTANPDDTLAFLGSRWIRIEPLAFQKEGGSDLLIFQTEGGALTGKINYLLLGNEAYERIPWFGSQTFHFALLAGCVLIFLLTAVAWPVASILKRKSARQPGSFHRMGIWISWGVSMANLAFLIIFAILIYYRDSLFYGFSSVQKGVFILPLFGLLFTLVSLWIILRQFTRERQAGWWNPFFRIYTPLVAIAGIGFAWWLDYWNLLGFHF